MEVNGKPQPKTSYLEDPSSIEDHLYGFMVDKNDVGKVFSPSVSAFLCQYYITIAWYSYFILSTQQCATAVADIVFKQHTCIHITDL